MVKDWWFSRFSLDPTRCQPQEAPSSFDHQTLQTPEIILIRHQFLLVVDVNVDQCGVDVELGDQSFSISWLFTL